MSSLEHQNVVIVVFAMPDCPACEEYVPRVKAAVEASRKDGFVVYSPGTLLGVGNIPLACYDVTSKDKVVQTLADRFKVEATPTTLIMSRGNGTMRFEGALNGPQISAMLNLAKMYR